MSSVTISVEQAELQTINHANRQRAIRITGNVGTGHSQSEVLDYVRTLAGQVPPGYSLVLSGQSSQFGDAMKSFFFAWIVGLIFAYMVLASQFNSLLHPITVLTILPLSLAGAMVTLLIMGKTLNVFSMIGLLLLMGIVKKNSIILVDYANEVRNKGNVTARDAMKVAGPVRLRPILMTAIATLMAAVPSALGLGPGAETRGPMADAIIGGRRCSACSSCPRSTCWRIRSSVVRTSRRRRPPSASRRQLPSGSRARARADPRAAPAPSSARALASGTP